MASYLATIAEAVKDSLNAPADGEFAESFTAVRVYRPTLDLESASLATLSVAVAVKSDSPAPATRGEVFSDILIDVGVRKRLTQSCNPERESANTELDALMEVVEQIAAHFEPGTEVVDAVYLARVERPVTYLAEHLDSKVFTAVLTLTLKRMPGA